MSSIERPTPTMPSSSLLMNPTALQPDPNIMNIMVVRENKENVINLRGRDDIILQNEHPQGPLPVAAALSSLSSKDPLHSSDSVNESSYKGQSYRIQTTNSSKNNGTKMLNMKGNVYVQ